MKEIGYDHPFCKIFRPESILDIPVNDNGLKKKLRAINSFLKTSWLDPMLRLLSKILALAKELSLVDHPLQVVVPFTFLQPAFLLSYLSTCMAEDVRPLFSRFFLLLSSIIIINII